jgi:predicted transcriptional regulator
MIMLCISIVGIIWCVSMQIILFRLCKHYSFSWIFSFVSYPIGLLITCMLLFFYPLRSTTLYSIAIPYVTLVFMILVLTLIFLWVLTPLLGEEGPTSMILRMLREKGNTKEEIIRCCSNDEMMIKRIESLQISGLLKKEKNVYTTTKKGEFFAQMINWYFGLIHWQQSA